MSPKIKLRYHREHLLVQGVKCTFWLAQGDLRLQDSDHMHAFAIVLQVSDASVTRLAEIGSTAEDNASYWLDAGAMEDLSGRKHDRQWLQDFRAMLASAAPYGFYDVATNKVKAHVEPFDA